ncbi:DegQ family serine endoprotease [soil metagenome]
MRDWFRRLLTLLAVLLLTAATFYLVRSRMDGYGLLDFLAAEKRPPAGEAAANREGGAHRYTPQESPRVAPESVGALLRLSEEFANVADAVRPSVVSINTTKRSQETRYYATPYGLYSREEEVAQPGLGSGVIVSEEGHIVTNYHVVHGVEDTDIAITTSDGAIFGAELIGGEEEVDLAVLQISGTGGRTFPALPFGDSSQVRVGEIVFAVGNPFGLGETVTQGIVSALPRRVTDSTFEMFQTDTVINPGNSGGPLVNLRGEIVGLNVAIYAGQQGIRTWQGVGLAIPSDDVRTTFEAIMATGRSLRGFLGVVAETTVRVSMELGGGVGVEIRDIVPGSPAEAAGLEVGDVVMRFADRPVVDGAELFSRITTYPTGKPAAIEIVRQGKSHNLTAVIGERSQYVPNPSGEGKADPDISGAFGITARNLSVYQRHRLGMDSTSPGIEVDEVKKDSPLAGALAPADIVYQLNETLIYTTDQFREEVDRLPLNRPFILSFLRDGRQNSVRIIPRANN